MKHAIGMKEQGFTLLELLVVITLLAVLSVGALVAYEGIGDNAQATAAANNTATVDRTIRTYRAVSLQYPNQWDNLSAAATAAPFSATMMADATKAAFGTWNVAADAATKSAVFGAFDNVGIDEVQQMAANATATGIVPNKQHNEGSNPASGDVEMNDAAFARVSIMPSSVGATACSAGGAPISVNFAGDAASATNDYNKKLNAVNDSLETDECQLVVALGFGHDAAHSTAGSPAAIVTAATYSSKNVNPATHYARYISLFHLGTDGANGGTVDNNIDDTEIFTKARLLAVVDPEGNSIDANIAKATQAN